MTIKEISIDFNKGVYIKTIDNGIPFPTEIMFSRKESFKYKMDQMIEWARIDFHFDAIMEGNTLEEIMEWDKESPCDHPDCPQHPYTWGKTQEELDKTYEQDFKKFHDMEDFDKW